MDSSEESFRNKVHDTVEHIEQEYEGISDHQKATYVRFPLIAFWIAIPFALGGFITSREMILFYTFVALSVFNIAFLFISHYVITRNKSKVLHYTYENLDEKIDLAKNKLEVVGEQVFNGTHKWISKHFTVENSPFVLDHEKVDPYSEAAKRKTSKTITTESSQPEQNNTDENNTPNTASRTPRTENSTQNTAPGSQKTADRREPLQQDPNNTRTY